MKSRVFIGILLISAIFDLNSFSQIKTINEAEYAAGVKDAIIETKKRERRVTTTTDSFNEGKRTGTELLIEEFQPPNKQRSFLTERTGKKSTTYEIIEVDDAAYRRVNSGMWAKFRRPQAEFTQLWGIPSPNDPKEVIKYSSNNATLNGQSVRILTRVSNKTYGFLMGAQTNETWVTNDGLILKTVEIISENAPENIAEKTIAIYEYNPKGLKIEMPIK